MTCPDCCRLGGTMVVYHADCDFQGTKPDTYWRLGQISVSLQITQECRVPASYHDDVIKWKYFPRNWAFVRGVHWSLVNSPHKGQWRGAWIFSLICAWINGWINSREDGDLRHHHAHYDVTVMFILKSRGEYIEGTERLLWGYLEQVALVIKYVIKYRFHSRKIAKLGDLADENSHQNAICILHAPYLCIVMIKMGIIVHSICKPWYCQRIWMMFVRIGLAVPLIWSDVMCVIDQSQYWLRQLH